MMTMLILVGEGERHGQGQVRADMSCVWCNAAMWARLGLGLDM